MEKSASWLVLVASIGSILATSATLLQYIQAHRAGQPGGYLPMMLGAVFVGLLVAGCNYFGKLQIQRSGFAAVLLGVLGAIVFLGVLFVTLIWSFGS